MNDLLSVARRLRGYADLKAIPVVTEEMQRDFAIAADVLATFNATLSAAAPNGNGQVIHHRFRDDPE